LLSTHRNIEDKNDRIKAKTDPILLFEILLIL